MTSHHVNIQLQNFVIITLVCLLVTLVSYSASSFFKFCVKRSFRNRERCDFFFFFILLLLLLLFLSIII